MFRIFKVRIFRKISIDFQNFQTAATNALIKPEDFTFSGIIT